jgi:hypothetical protein
MKSRAVVYEDGSLGKELPPLIVLVFPSPAPASGLIL